MNKECLNVVNNLIDGHPISLYKSNTKIDFYIQTSILAAICTDSKLYKKIGENEKSFSDTKSHEFKFDLFSLINNNFYRLPDYEYSRNLCRRFYPNEKYNIDSIEQIY